MKKYPASNRNRNPMRKELWFVAISYTLLVIFFSGIVHESVHLLQDRPEKVLSVCFMGIQTSIDNDDIVHTFKVDTFNTILNSVGGGWVEIEVETEQPTEIEYLAGINKDEFQAYFFQFLFLFIFLRPVNQLIKGGYLAK